MSGHQEVTYALDFRQSRRENKTGCDRQLPAGETASVPIPRIARLLALAIRFEGLGAGWNDAGLCGTGPPRPGDASPYDPDHEATRSGSRHSGRDPVSAAHPGPQREKPAAHRQPDRLGRAAAHVSEDHGPCGQAGAERFATAAFAGPFLTSSGRFRKTTGFNSSGLFRQALHAAILTRSCATASNVRPSPSSVACLPVNPCQRWTTTSAYLGSSSSP